MAKFATNSRFSLLKIDDDEDEGETMTKPKSANTAKGQVSAGAKRKSKKKKKAEAEKAENDQLRNMAFAGSVPVKGSKGHGASSGQRNDGRGDAVSPEQWEEWKKMDKEATKGSYEADLQQALLLSKLELQREKEMRANVALVDEAKGKDKKKKKKEKPATMSLDAFNQLAENTDTHPDLVNGSLNSSQKLPTSPPSDDPDPTFFDKVSDDVSKIIRKEQIQEEYRKQYLVESKQMRQHNEESEQKEKEVKTLRATVQNLEDELKQVKRRNKQLCHILAQGEMKEKSEILVQVDQLNQVKDELTDQVSNLMVELEKERSKNHLIKAELDRYKSGKLTGGANK
ncbi:unnamed protein product [Owenia fusiformis]|uniref:Uncharacterized protein n=1 Tax=Owenia fusiformis TaxID=6347 RepID=A0A8J1TU57_OWEFU|nr:unnamed protein product [Owenia fusiformis]